MFLFCKLKRKNNARGKKIESKKIDMISKKWFIIHFFYILEHGLD